MAEERTQSNMKKKGGEKERMKANKATNRKSKEQQRGKERDREKKSQRAGDNERVLNRGREEKVHRIIRRPAIIDPTVGGCAHFTATTCRSGPSFAADTQCSEQISA